jgi:hypothetical protein
VPPTLLQNDAVTDELKDLRIPVMMAATEVAAIDDWRRRQHGLPSRSEAIRRLVELGLTENAKVRPKSEDAKQRQETKRRARELAGIAVDEISDRTASADDQASRKRRLIKGPDEFQNERRDRPNRR